MQIHIFTKYWNNSRFKQNLALILTEAMYLDRRHPFMQKSYFGQNVTYTVFALRGRIVITSLGEEEAVCFAALLLVYLHFEPTHDKTNKMTIAPSEEDSDQSGHLHCQHEEILGPQLPIYPLSTQ